MKSRFEAHIVRYNVGIAAEVENAGLKEQLAVAQSQLTVMENERSDEQARRVAEEVEKSREIPSTLADDAWRKRAEQSAEEERQKNVDLVQKLAETRYELKTLKKSAEDQARKAAEQLEETKDMGARGTKAWRTWSESEVKNAREENKILRQQLQAAPSEIAAAKEERQEARAEVAAMEIQLDEARSSSTALEEKLRLAREGLQVAAWEEKVNVAEAQ